MPLVTKKYCKHTQDWSIEPFNPWKCPKLIEITRLRLIPSNPPPPPLIQPIPSTPPIPPPPRLRFPLRGTFSMNRNLIKSTRRKSILKSHNLLLKLAEILGFRHF